MLPPIILTTVPATKPRRIYPKARKVKARKVKTWEVKTKNWKSKKAVVRVDPTIGTLCCIFKIYINFLLYNELAWI